MRLIDADALKRDLKSVTLSNGTLLNTNTVLLLLDKYPTAYDVDGVVQKLDEMKRKSLYGHAISFSDEDLGKAFGFEIAIDVVKRDEVKKMTNREKYAEQILDIACSGNLIAVNKETGKPVGCNIINCHECKFNCGYITCNAPREHWCKSECVEPKIDWSKVPVDTPILVRDHESALWRKAHFAKYKNNKIYTWFGGRTSWSGTGMVEWNYAKLAEDGE